MLSDRYAAPAPDPEDTWVVIRLRDVAVCLGYVLIFLLVVTVLQWVGETLL